MWFRRGGRWRAGGTLSARSLNALAEWLEWSSRAQGGDDIEFQALGSGPLFSLSGPAFDARVAITTTPITPRAGGTPGSGTVQLQEWTGEAPGQGTFAQAQVQVTAYNISAAAAGIAEGKWCVVLLICGSWFIITAEC